MIIFVRKKLQLGRDGGACTPGSGPILIVGLSAGQCTIPVDTLPTGVQKDVRRGGIASRSTCTYRERVNINLDSRESRGETMKKSESDSESEKIQWMHDLEERVQRLEKMLEAAIEEINALQRGNNTGLKHQNDGGWFD